MEKNLPIKSRNAKPFCDGGHFKEILDTQRKLLCLAILIPCLLMSPLFWSIRKGDHQTRCMDSHSNASSNLLAPLITGFLGHWDSLLPHNPTSKWAARGHSCDGTLMYSWTLRSNSTHSASVGGGRWSVLRESMQATRAARLSSHPGGSLLRCLGT